MHELLFQPLCFLMQNYFLGGDIHLNRVIAVETFSTKKNLLAIKKWRLVFTFPTRCTEKIPLIFTGAPRS